MTHMMARGISGVFAAYLAVSVCAEAQRTPDENPPPLRWSTYMTAGTVQNLLEETTKPEVVLQELGVSKVYLEVYRGGLVVAEDRLQAVRDYFEDRGFDVAGGIATVPGADFGVRQVGPLGWFNWENEKTRRDIEGVMRMSARVFDEFIVDDFLCTGDVSEESDEARAGRPWSDYRRDLMVEVAREHIIGAAHESNPDITLTVKYPQWYDRFHLFGYDVPRMSSLFDLTWVGTETRGARTQRYGYVQPYEGFVNYRWIASIAGGKTAGAWFDHGDCDEYDFMEQAYQTVMAGAPEIVLFNYGNLREGHPGHVLLKQEQTKLARLSDAVRRDPVVGVAAYKPPNSDAGGDLYLMDFLGMLGISLVPQSTFPADAQVVFVPTQVAADAQAGDEIARAVSVGRRVIVTAGFLARVAGGDALSELAGLESAPAVLPRPASSIRVDGKTFALSFPLDVEADMKPGSAEVLVWAGGADRSVPFLTRRQVGEGAVFVLNAHTYSQEDFDRVGEVLLAPRPLGILELPDECVAVIRDAFMWPFGIRIEAPARVSLQLFGDGFLIQNNRQESALISVNMEVEPREVVVGGFTGEVIESAGASIDIEVAPRSRRWIRVTDAG